MLVLTIYKNSLAIARLLGDPKSFIGEKRGRHINDDLYKNTKVIEESILAKIAAEI